MAVSYTPVIPSGSTNGMPIKLANTPTLLHTATSDLNVMDEVWVWINNTSASAVDVTVETDDNTPVDDEIASDVTIGAKEGMVLVVPGIRLENGRTIEAKGSTTDVLTATVVVNRIDTAA